MGRWLLIENLGVCGTDLMTIVGASTSRSNDEMLGQFGSGFKYSVALLLRQSIGLRVYVGTNGYEFGVDERSTRDVTGNRFDIREVVMKQVAGSGRKTKGMGFDVSFGEIDWQDVGMAAREFISNAADASMALSNNYDKVRVEIVDEPGKWAKEGHTRVYIQATGPIVKYFEGLHENFLIFDTVYDKSQTILPKKDPGSNVRIYRKGVLAGTFNYPSLFDYNFHDIDVNECRIVRESSAKDHCTAYLREAPEDSLIEYLEAIRDGKAVWETTQIDLHGLRLYSWEKTTYPATLNRWKNAIRRVFSDDGVVCQNDREVDAVGRKGLKPVRIDDGYLAHALASFEMKSANDVLDSFERDGRTKIELSAPQQDFCRSIWNRLVGLGVTEDKPMPEIEGYHDLMNSGSNILGYYDRERKVVGLSRDILDTKFLLTKTFIEEASHYISGAGDCTRDLQDIAFRIAAKLME